MKIQTVIGIILIIIGLMSAIYFLSIPNDGGIPLQMLGLYMLSIPLTILGILLLSSMTGTFIFIIGIAVFALVAIYQSINRGTMSNMTPLIIGGAVCIIGILYGIIEGITKLVKNIK